MIGKRLGDYEILKEIGEGGMGTVYLGRNVFLPDMFVVLKVLKFQAQKERFAAEATNLSRLNHKNICQMKHFFQFEESVVLAMEYIDGYTLGSLVEKQEKVDLQQIKDIFLQVLDGLSYAHGKGISHRDIKPSNIMIDKNDVVKIIDFGIARHTEDTRYTTTGIAIGTPQYMAPEQFTSETIEDFQSCDIYAVGISLYKSCCNVLPFDSTNPFILKELHCKEDPASPSKYNPHVTHSLERVIMTALEKKPSRRHASAEIMRRELEAASVGVATQTTAVRGRRRSRKGVYALAALLLVVLLTVAVYKSWDRLAPLLSVSPHLEIESQTIAEGETFAPVDLSQLVPPDSAQWAFGGNSELVANLADDIFSISPPDDNWFGAETITFIAAYRDGRRDSTQAQFTVSSVNDPPQVNGTIDQKIMEGESFQSIRLDDYVSDVENEDDEINWSWSSSASLDITVDRDRVARMVPASGWSGVEKVIFEATDQDGGSGSLTASFEVVLQPKEIAAVEPEKEVTPEPESQQEQVVEQKPPAEKRTEEKPAQQVQVKQAEEEPDQPVVSTKLPDHMLNLRVLPEGARIYDEQDKMYTDYVAADPPPGTYVYTIYHPDFPIREIELTVDADPVELTMDLQDYFSSDDKGKLAVSMFDEGNTALKRTVYFNRTVTTYATETSLPRYLFAGIYEIRADLRNMDRIDSLVVTPPEALLEFQTSGGIAIIKVEKDILINATFYVTDNR
ncbi:MAG: protein kinase [candidate division Zixibacteria bacterium]|nr:protein kinase [candidate division Zixibacteria bacterium]